MSVIILSVIMLTVSALKIQFELLIEHQHPYSKQGRQLVHIHKTPPFIFTTLHFLRNLRMGPIS
jgi:hypothetical protein